MHRMEDTLGDLPRLLRQRNAPVLGECPCGVTGLRAGQTEVCVTHSAVKDRYMLLVLIAGDRQLVKK